MFTGIIESVGNVLALKSQQMGMVLEIESGLDLSSDALGDSIAVDGVCLTMTAKNGGRFSALASAETIKRSTLGQLKPGTKVNLERALTLSARLGGHLVLGHVDTVSIIREKGMVGESLRLVIDLPHEYARYVIEKGSIAVDGVSLTVNEMSAQAFTLNIIPHTLASTSLTLKGAGARVNLEFDVIGKYVERLMKNDAPHDKTWEELLKKQGYI
jgi:riboflavin synthase